MSGGKYADSLTLNKTHEATPAQIAALKHFESNMAPLLAGSYNNLGVHAAMANDFPRAEAGFRMAARWNSALQGVDSNWGRAAYAAGDYAGAVAPLERALASNPYDGELHSVLEACRWHVAQ